MIKQKMIDLANKERLVSVIMAVYNQEQFVSDAIESVINQTYGYWELIICDDGSVDNTYNILNKYKQLYPEKIRILRNDKNYGVSGARNKALRQANGDYIAFLDSDDYWNKEKLEKQLNVFNNSRNIGLVFTSANVISDSASLEADRIFLERNFNKLASVAKLEKEDLIKENNICFSSIVISKNAMEIIRYFDEGLLYQVEDWLLVMKALYLFDFACISEKLVNYRLHKDSYSAKVFLKERMKKDGFNQVYNLVISFTRRYLFKGGVTSNREKIKFIFSLFYNLHKENTVVWLRTTVFTLPIRKAKKAAGHLKRYFQNINLMYAKKLLILFVTSKCNSRCKTCFYWQNLNNKANDLELQEIKNIFNSLPKTICVLITGGEPFLRNDIEQILESATYNKNILSVAINSNGTKPDLISSVIDKTLTKRKYPKPYHLNISLDGPKEIHNKIRGIDCYDDAIFTLSKAKEFKRYHKNFFISAVTVISKENIDQIEEFANFIYEKMHLSYHYFEIIRGNPSAIEILQIDRKKLDKLYRNILLVQERYLKRNELISKDIAKMIGRAAHLYRLQFDNFFENKPWDVKCQAGNNTFVIYEDGSFSACELRKPVFNLKEHKFNVKDSLNSKALNNEIKKIGSEKCFCTHGCFISNSL